MSKYFRRKEETALLLKTECRLKDGNTKVEERKGST